jgi:hypothetical protein
LVARFSKTKPPLGQRRRTPRAVLVSQGDGGPTFRVGQELREAAEAAQPPSAEALEVLAASRALHRADKALRTAAGAEEFLRLRSALEQAEEALRVALKPLQGDGT